MTLEKAEQSIKECPEEELIFNAFLTIIEAERNACIDYAINSDLSGLIREFNAGQAAALSGLINKIKDIRQ